MPSLRGKQLVLPALSLVAAASMWFYARSISVPRQVAEGARLERPRGNLSDLYPRWLGARELLLHGRDPYSPEITREIQRGYYGREIDPSRPNDPKDKNAFAYPVYVVFFLAPTVDMNFATVKILSFWFLTILTVASVLLWQCSIRSHPRTWRTLTILALLLGSYPFIEAVSLQQPVLLVAALFAASFLARQRQWLFVSGVLLAVATIKPQTALLPVIITLMWVSGDWRGRRRWFWGFAATMLVLLIASELVLPGWAFRFYQGVREYRTYMGGTSFLDWLVTPRWSGVAWVLITLLALWVGWKFRKSEAADAYRVFSLALVAAVCTSPNLAFYNQVLLLPGLLFWIESSGSFREGGMLARALSSVVVGLLAWPWLACLILIGARLLGAEGFVQRAWQLPHYAALSLPVVLLILLMILPPVSVPSRQTSPAAEILA